MPRAGIPCWRCPTGSIMPDLAGAASCVACGAGPEPPVLATAETAPKGTNRPRWDRAADSAWKAAS